MVVFLDIDGVLNRKQDRRVPYRLHQPCVKEFKKFLSKVGDLKIGLISSWRHGFISSGNKNNSPQIKKLEKVLYPYRIVGKN